MPSITVLMPVYNAEKHLSEAIESILNQTYKDFEFLIINDGSSDQSESIINRYNDKRIRYIKNNTNLKIAETLNKGISLAKGKYIARMDADDISLPERLMHQVDFLDSNPDVGVCGTWFRTTGISNRTVRTPVDDPNIKSFLFFNSPFCHPSVMIRKEILLLNNITYEDILYAEDYLLWIKLSRCTKMANIPEVLFIYREHDRNISLINKERQEHNANNIRCIYLKQEFGSMFDDSIYNDFCKFYNSKVDIIISRKREIDFFNFYRILFNKITIKGNVSDKIKKHFIFSFDHFLDNIDHFNFYTLSRLIFSKFFYLFVKTHIARFVKRI